MLPAPAAIEMEIEKQYGVRAIGRIATLRERFYDPSHFLAADHYGGFAVGLVVIFTGFRVMRGTSLDLVDTMPEENRWSSLHRMP
jgi:divalent metal cation (Fe/Co/Zn/Cd) transporter